MQLRIYFLLLALSLLFIGCDDGAPDLMGDGDGGPGPSGDMAVVDADVVDADVVGADVGTPDALVAFASAARRLSQGELDRTLWMLFGDDTASARRLLPEDEFAPFDNDYPEQRASLAWVESLEVLANELANDLIADPVRLAGITPCTPQGPEDQDCFRQTVAALGHLALRRALVPAEVEAYDPLLSLAAEAPSGEPFAVAVGLLVRALVQDPEFLHRVERGRDGEDGDVRSLTSAEIVTRMAFLLWGTAPDADALADAADEDLSDPVARRVVAERMLEDPRAKQQLHRFHAMWIGYRQSPHDPQLVAAFQRETAALIDRAIFEDEQYLTLFNAPETFVDPRLANHYGLAVPAGEEWVAYNTPERAGILSHGSVLGAHSKGFSDSSPTQRGKFVRERLMCQVIPPPPPTVDVDQPPGDAEAACKVERYRQHAADPGCAGCHALMDPIGFGLERFDLAGRYREHDPGLPECVIEGVGDLPGAGEFSGPGQLATLLIDGGHIDACAIQNYLQFAIGRALRPNEAGYADARLEAFRGDHALKAWIVDLVADEPFATLRLEPTP
ncbi:MAG: hypothetical protein ACI9U2_002333 [Bradymonadia bacterium]|jgi:hypothetical protein